jgi:hypothetical protein
MTIKEIKELTNKSYKTICNWCSSVNNSDISEKITQAKEKSKPADFTLDETIVILRAGKISESLISLLTENAKIKQSNNLTVENNRLDRLEQLVENLINAIPNLINTTQQQPKLLIEKKEKYTVREYCEKQGFKLYSPLSFYIQVGRKASSLCKEILRPIEFKKENDYNVAIYDLDILAHCVDTVRFENESKKDLFNGGK